MDLPPNSKLGLTELIAIGVGGMIGGGIFSVLGIAPDTVADLVNPPLSTIDFPIYDMSYRAAKMLIRRLDHDPADVEQILIKAKIEVRQTTGPLKE